MMGERSIRVLLAKPGLDGHERGVKVVARALMDAGMEVIYTGMRLNPEEIVNIAIQEDVDVIGISNHSAAHATLTVEVARLARKKGLHNVTIVAGGTVLPDDEVQLRKVGVSGIFGPGSPVEDIVKLIKDRVIAGRAQEKCY